MPSWYSMVFTIILPLHAVLAMLGIVANRSRVSKQIGRDPIVVRPLHATDAPHRHQEDRETPGALVSGGVYQRVRHPIYSGMLLVVSGVAFVTGDLISIAVAGAAWVGIPLQARLEEEFLLSRHGDEYRKYKERTGRFWPAGLSGK